MSREITHELAPPVKDPNAWVGVLIGVLIRIVLVTALVVGVIWGLRWWVMHKPVLQPDSAGKIELTAKAATLHGEPEIRFHFYQGQPNIGWWDKESQSVSWKVKGLEPGRYDVLLHYSRAPQQKLQMELKAGEDTLTGDVAPTGGWDKWEEKPLGQLEIREGGVEQLSLHAITPEGGAAINLVKVTLQPVAD